MRTPIEAIYAAAHRAGLLVEARIGGETLAVGFSAPDETVLDGLALSTDYTMRYPATRLPDLAAGDAVVIGLHAYQVRTIRSVGDGSEQLASLTRV